jgi:predicted aspartyl protease
MLAHTASRLISRARLILAPASAARRTNSHVRARLTHTPRIVVLALMALVALGGLAGCTVAFGQPVVTGCDNGITAPVHVQRDITGSTIVIASVTIDGHGPYPLAVDTGASVSILDRSVAESANLPQVGNPEPVAGVGGSQNATPVQVDSWSVGKITLPAMRIASLSLPEAQKTNGIVGLLGSDVLSRFGVVQIDYSNGTLVVFAQIVPSPTAKPRG